MRELNLLRTFTLEDPSLSDLVKCLVVTETTTSKMTKLFVFNKYTEVYQLNITDDFKFENIFVADLAQFADMLLYIPTVAGCNFVYNELLVILSHGYLVSIIVNGDSEDNEALGISLDVGSTKLASWSPDYERTVLINSEDKLFVLSIVNVDFEKLNEISLQDVSEEQNQFVNVGWGSAATQFQGSAGKFSRAATGETFHENIADRNIHVCWKQNGTAFAVSYVCQTQKNRKVKVFSQDGVLLNVTKDIHGLQSPIDWNPSKNLLFCPQTLPNKQIICFLEENALKHGDFGILEDMQMKQLLWNTSGTILACYGTTNNREFIALWTTNNYKWYMKQNLSFVEPVIFVQWDILSPNRLHVVLKSGVYRSYEWTWQINESSKHGDANNKALVSSINGPQLGVTPYALVNKPPSMPFKTYDFSPNFVNAVIFPETFDGCTGDFDCNSMILYLSNESLHVLKYDEPVGVELKFSLKKEPIRFNTPSEISAFLWMLPNIFYFSWCKAGSHYFCVSNLDMESKTVTVTETFKVDSLILTSCSHNRDVIVHLDNGKLYLYHDESLRSMELAFIEPCLRLQMLNDYTLIALSENRNLYVNETIKWRDVTSYYWKPPFIVLMTMDSQLLISKVNFAEKRVSFDEVLSRDVEPKSYLVTVVDDRVLLEMERGNLEVIVPRPFSIFEMEDKLRNAHYFEAFKMLRKQRINLNVLFDHDPTSFINNIRDIIDNVSDPMYLLTFIMELEDVNVAANMFPWKYADAAKSVPNKIDTTCDNLCAAIKEKNNPKLMAPLIAALVKQNKLAEAAKYAIEYKEIPTLIHLTDPIAVYKATLRSFDLVNALQIIQHSKLDPSEYLPFLRQLQTMEDNYRKFKICDFLEDHTTALTYLADCDEDDKFDECVKYMNKYQLFRTALEVFYGKSCESVQLNDRYMIILTIVAENHFQNQCFSDAGILFEKANLNERALKCYLTIGDWFSAISILKFMNAEAESVQRTCREVYDVLLRQGKHEDAGFVAYHFISHCELAINAYLTARKYCNAINVTKGLRKQEAISEIIRPALVEEAKSFMNQFETNLTSLVAQEKRLQEVREKKNQLEGDHYDDDRLSVISSLDSSDASSVSSRSSRVSSVSSSAKRARRRERKMWNLKPGNRREEPSLLNVIRQTAIQHVKNSNEAIPDLMKALLKTDELVLARQLKTSYLEFLKSIQNLVDRIWNEANLPEDGAGFQDILITCPPDITPFKNDLTIINCK